MEAHEATGIGAIQRALDQSTMGSIGKVLEQVQLGSFDSGIGTAVRAITERNMLFSERIHAAIALQQSPFSEMLDRYRAPALGIQKALEAYRTSIPSSGIHLGSALRSFDFERIGRTFERININPGQGAQFAAVSERLAEQVNAFRSMKVLEVDYKLSSNIGDLLARSLEAQEALLEEQREYAEAQRDASEAAQTEALFHRRMAYFSALIAMLTFFWVVAHDLEERFENDEVQKADRDQILQMQTALENMSDQLAELQRVEEKRAEKEDAEAIREAEADKELASIMREIAEGLRQEPEDIEGPLE